MAEDPWVGLGGLQLRAEQQVGDDLRPRGMLGVGGDDHERDVGERAGSSPYALSDYGETREELPAAEVPRLERRWQQEVLRG
jgi:hypothetical protein